MSPEDVAEHSRKRAVPWDEVRAARVQRRVLAEVRATSGHRSRDGRPAIDPAQRDTARARSLSRPLAWALAAAALIAALVLILTRLPRETRVTRLDLADGSFVVLDASARVVPGIVTPERIELHQSAGSASYEVTPTPGRTFVVLIEDVRVEVLGTIFRVEQMDRAVRVTVQRGRVQVSRGSRTVSLVAGEEVTLGNTDPGRPPGPAAAQPPSPSAPAAEPTAAAATTGAVATVQPPGASTTGAGTPTGSATATVDDPGPAELFRRADSARAAGNVAEALRLLNLLAARHPRDGRATLAVFTIARLEAQRGNHARAAATFESLGSAFGGEALAEAALAHAAAGQPGKARVLASRYTSLFPDGPRAPQLARLVE